MAFLKWVRTIYEALSLLQWLSGLPIWGGSWGLIALSEITSAWPLWIQVLAAAGVAVVWLTVLGGGNPAVPKTRISISYFNQKKPW